MTNTTITPGVGSLSLAGFAPTLKITPGVGSLAFTGYAPSLYETPKIDLLLRTLSATGSPGYDATFDLLLRSISATGISGYVANVTFGAPLRTLFVTANDGARFVAPLRSLSATGVVGALGSASFKTPLRSLSASGSVSVFANASFSTLLRTLSSRGITGITASASFVQPRRTLLSGAYVGIVARASFGQPLRTLSTNGYPALVGNLSITEPLRYITADGFSSPSENYRTWVMNLRTGSLVEYDNFSFNSLVKFGTNYLASGPNGLFVLDGETDDGAEIDSVLRTGLDGFGESFLKRVPRIYWSGSQEGDLHFSTITTEGGRRTYSLIDNGIRGEQQRRVPVGKGPKAVRWQFEVVNRRGANFSVSEILVYPTNLRRRIQ